MLNELGYHVTVRKQTSGMKGKHIASFLDLAHATFYMHGRVAEYNERQCYVVWAGSTDRPRDWQLVLSLPCTGAY